MTRSPVRIVLILTTALLALAPATALADKRDQIIRDCSDDGRLQGNYSKSEIRDARQNMPSDVAEYTDCEDVLRRAENPDRGGTTGTPGGGTTPGGTAGGTDGREPIVPMTDADRSTLAATAAKGDEPVVVDGKAITPGASGLAPGSTRNGVPGTLLVVLILLGLGGAAALVPAARRIDVARLLRRS